MTSILIGTSGLAALLLVSGLLTLSRPRIADGVVASRFATLTGIAIAVQGLHFIEELLFGFHRKFPAQLGLEQWTDRFFVAFNLVWLVVWIAALLMVRQRIVAALWPLWFLAIALTANGIVHPLLALRAGGYFPGLYTAPLAALAGLALLREMGRITK